MTSTTVNYDHRAVSINGKRTLLLSGAIHYPRSTPAMWPQLLQQSRQAGLNTIETYVFWNLHERQRGVFDFAERLDLLRFCQVAQEHGLYVILRVGPYICAETNYGGFPAWLRDLPGIRMRTFNQPFMREMERWVRMVTDYLRPLFAPRGGPIILFQLENEYNLIAKTYGEDGQRYLQWVSKLAHDLHLDIPTFMCLGAATGCLETINGFYAHLSLDAHFTRHPDQPALWTETWLAWYDTYGYAHKTRSSEDCAYGVARFIASGGTGVNHYMWHGGTNFERSAMYLQTTSYDCDAPLNAYGHPTTKLHHLARLHAILNEYADLIVTHERALAISLGEEQHAYVYQQSGRELIFLCNDAPREANVTFATQQMGLPAHSVSLLSSGRVLMNTAEIKPEHIIEQHIEVQANPIARPRWYEEPLPAQWPELLHAVQVVTDAPVEQLRLTQDRTDYCWYSTNMQVSADQAGPGTLTLQGVADVAHIFVNGDLQATSHLPLSEDRGAVDDVTSGFTQSFSLTLTPGTHTLSILTCALGLIKGDWMLGGHNMAEERKGFWGQALWNEERIPGPWSIAPGLVGERGTLFADGAALVPWQENWQEAVGHPLRWWQLHFPRPQADHALVVDLSSMRKGVAWLNGRCIGRYWLTPGTNELPDWQVPTLCLKHVGEPSQQYYNLPREWLQDQNMLVLFEEIGGDPSRVSLGSVVMKASLSDSQEINTRKVGIMKVLVWHGPRSMTVEQREVPKPGPGEALVQVKAVGICGSEVEGYLGQNSLRFPPLIMGHEFSGEIVEPGSMRGESPTPGIGQRVTVNPLVSCGACIYCKADLTHVCPNRKLIGAHRPGAFADYVVVPQRSVIPLPDTLPHTLAALTEPFAVSIHGVELAHLKPEDAVVVWGAGTIGLLAICAARQAHPTRIIAVDTNEARLAAATAAGATTVLDARSDSIIEQVRSLVSDVPHVVVFDAVGRSITRVASAVVAGPCGQVILLGLHEKNTSLDVAALIRSEIALQGCYAYSREDLHRAVAWLAAGFVPTGPWIDVRPLEAGPDAFLELADRPGAATKIVMVP